MRVSPHIAIVRILLLAGLFCLPGLGRAQLVFNASQVGLPPATKHVKTMRDLRYRDVVQQQFDFSCGSAALGTVLQYGYGITISEPELIRRMLAFADAKEVMRNGFSMLDMKQFVETIGLRGRGFKVEPNALYRLKIPVLALMDVKGYRHFVVVRGAAAGRVFVSDPALGNRVIREKDFVASWNGIVLAIVGDRPMLVDSPLLGGVESVALRRRTEALERATTRAPLFEFGLTEADLF